MQGPLPRPGSRPTRASAVVRRGGRSVIGAVQPGSAGGGLPGLGSELVHAADAVGLEPGRRFLFELFSGGERAARAVRHGRVPSSNMGVLIGSPGIAGV